MDASEMHRRVIERFKVPEQGVRLLVEAGVLDASGRVTPRYAPNPPVEQASRAKKAAKSVPD